MNKILRTLISRKAGIYWQIYFGIIIIIGSIVPQGDASQISNGNLPQWLKSFLLFIKAHQLYTSPLFIISLIFFFIALSFSTYKIVFPIFKTILKKTITPSKKALVNYETKLELNGIDFDKVENLLKNKKYNLVHKEDKFFHFEKFKWSRSSAMIAHISLFIILIGVTYGLLTSFKSTIALVPSEKASINYIVSKSSYKGYFVNDDKDNWSIRVNNFWMDFYSNGMVKQYYSDVSILDNNDKEILKKTIYVNEPLIYKNIYFYQASWGISHLNIEIDNKLINAILNPLKNNQGHASDKVRIGDKEFIFYLDNQNKIYLFDLKANPITEFVKGISQEINNKSVKVNDIVLFTGLQVKKDLGIPLIYFGFVLLIISLIINFFNYSQIFILEYENKYYIIGKANKGLYLLEQEMNNIADAIENNLINRSHIQN
ncbi:MAG: cytochrome c biogenesis protein CcsB [Candidatus Sericytochromatia bacterium]|nr:MAG: cytochrome c biogenesis protein CcsB [Candidatus Sericytochromatia bacterium]